MEIDLIKDFTHIKANPRLKESTLQNRKNLQQQEAEIKKRNVRVLRASFYRLYPGSLVRYVGPNSITFTHTEEYLLYK